MHFIEHNENRRAELRAQPGNIVDFWLAKPVRVEAPQQLVRSERHNSISSIGPPSQVSADTVALNAKPIAYTARSGGSQHKFRIASYTAPVAAGTKPSSTELVDVPALVAGAKGGDLNPCFALGTFAPNSLGRDRISLLYFPKMPQAPIPGGGFLEKVGNGYVHFHHYRGMVRDTKFADTVDLRVSGTGTTLKQLAYSKLQKGQTVLLLVRGSGLIPVTVGSVKDRFVKEKDGKREISLGLDIGLIVSKSFHELTTNNECDNGTIGKPRFHTRAVLFDINELALPEPEFPFDFSTRTLVEDSKLPAPEMSDLGSVRLHTSRPAAALGESAPVPAAGDALTQLKPRTNALIPGQTFNPIPTNAFPTNPYVDRGTQSDFTYMPPHTTGDQHLADPSAPPADTGPDTKRSLPPGTVSWTEPPPNSFAPENRPAGTSDSFAATAPSAKPTPVPAAGDDLTQQLDAMPMPTRDLNPPSAPKPQAPKKRAVVLAGATGTPQAQLKPRTNALVPGQTFNSIPTDAFAENPYIGRDTQRPLTIYRFDDQDTFAPSAPPAGAESPVSNGGKRSLSPGALSWTDPPPNSIGPENRPAGMSESFAASGPAPMETPRESKHEAGPPAGESGGVKTAGRPRLAEDWLGAKPFEAVTVGGRDFTFLKRQPQASGHGGIVTICRPALARDQVSNWESDVLGKSHPRVISISMTGARTLDQRDFYSTTPVDKVPSPLLGESMIVYDLHLAEPTTAPDPKLYQDPLEKD